MIFYLFLFFALLLSRNSFSKDWGLFFLECLKVFKFQYLKTIILFKSWIPFILSRIMFKSNLGKEKGIFVF